jgi:hypothetical protein
VYVHSYLYTYLVNSTARNSSTTNRIYLYMRIHVCISIHTCIVSIGICPYSIYRYMSMYIHTHIVNPTAVNESTANQSSHTRSWRLAGCLMLRWFFAKEPLIIGLLCGKCPTKIRHPMTLCHPAYWHVYIYVYTYIYMYIHINIHTNTLWIQLLHTCWVLHRELYVFARKYI